MGGGRHPGDPSYCRDCNAMIVFARTAKGKMMPCEPGIVAYVEDPAGDKQVLAKSGELVRATVIATREKESLYCEEIRYGHLPHFGSCISSTARRRQEAYKRQGGSGIAAPGTAFAPKKADKPAPAPAAAPVHEQLCMFGAAAGRGGHPE